MLRKNLVYLVFILVCLSLNVFAQSQDPPTVDELKRQIIKREYTDVSDKERWEIKVEYPELRLAGDKPSEGFRLAAKNLAMKQVEDFKKTMSEFTEEDRKFLPDEMNFTLDVGYSIEFENDEFISVNFGRSEFTGGAHPNHWSFTLNYDLKNNKELQLSDLFKQNSNYLSIISKNSIEQLTKEQGESADADWLKEGAGEDLKNFESWNITKNGLKFSFDPYQVGPYAAGAFETVVPYEKFPTNIQSSMFYRVGTVSYIDGNPPNNCRNGLYTTQDVDFKLARILGKKNDKTYFYGDEGDCPNGKNCQKKAYLIAGDEVIVSKTYGDFVCAWYQPKKGSETVGWIPANMISANAPQKPGNVDWVGEWVFGENSIDIQAAQSRGKYSIKGNAFWKGVGDNIHIGELDYEGLPVKDKMNVGDGEDQYDCRVKMQILGKYLLVSDNLNCGGLNVSFNGIYQRK